MSVRGRGREIDFTFSAGLAKIKCPVMDDKTSSRGHDEGLRVPRRCRVLSRENLVAPRGGGGWNTVIVIIRRSGCRQEQ